MSERMYLLDFRYGTVEEIDNAAPPRGLEGPAQIESSDATRGPGYLLAALGSPPSSDAE